MYAGKIPFLNGETPLHYPEHRSGETIEWVDNYKFTGTLVLVDRINTGRSAKYLSVTIDEKPYIMFVKDFMGAIIKYGAQPGGLITGEWCFCKRGQNYGVCATQGDT